ncbi:MAG: phosphoribosylamine--glycine ligase [Aestuariivirga sp.]|uniref:phosphoribosylamine--glycine ligase n=1 Tax=Aestuariivirga sp. TaxID=2650926 RepID=UPI0025BF5680|nr:phosphoribosylamine--glycine ligase [Aestuariivirga sp.]MCA3559702.1 phosphoribosylamine--glycine ligase [Aestuariivirga sp.]
MNILLIGSGGREHALAWAIAASPLCDRLFVAPGNPGIGQIARNVELEVADHAAVTAFCRAENIGLVVVGPEAPLVAGLADDLAAAGIKCFGPKKFPAQLEGSKGFTKDICAKYGIPTAAYGRFQDKAAALAYLETHGAPIVIKADGLAAGKGVTVALDMAEARAAVEDIFSGKFCGAGCVIEEFLEGEEASFFVLTDGKHALPLATAQDHKRVGDGDTGPNTGGMGAYSPAPCMTPALCDEALEKIVKPTIRALQEMGHPYAGVLYAGLILTGDGPKLIEYNCRFGDPEAQVLMMRLKDDLVTLLLACCDGTLDKVSARWFDDVALTVVMCAQGYPGGAVKGTEIRGLEGAAAMEGVEIFHAGTAERDGAIVANGGRVLNVTARGATVREARDRAYAAVDRIDWPDGFCRRDIAWRALARGETR